MKHWSLPVKILVVILCLLLTAGLGFSVLQYRQQEQNRSAELQVKAKEALEKERARERNRVRVAPPAKETPAAAQTEAPAPAPTETPTETSTPMPTETPTEMSTLIEPPTPSPTDEPAEPVMISCRGDAWQSADGADRATGWPAALQTLLDDAETDVEVYDGTWDMAGTLSQLRYAGVSAEVTDTYIEAHRSAGLGEIRTETVVRADLEEVYQERTDTEAIPVICMGYYGGFGQDPEELVQQQADLLRTYQLPEDENLDVNTGEMNIKGRFLILGYLPLSINDAAGYDAAMEKAWGDHYLSLNETEGDLFSDEFRRNVAGAVYEKLTELGYV